MAHPSTRLVILSDALREAGSSGSSRPVFGLCREAEGLLQILTAHPDEASLLRPMGTVNPTGEPVGRRTTFLIDGHDLELELGPGLPFPDDIQLVSDFERRHDRARGVVSVERLKGQHVLLSGLGSLGSQLAVPLAQAGVEHFTCADRDWFDLPNLSRHLGDLLDLGRGKPEVVAEKLRLRGAKAVAVTIDFVEASDEELDQLLRGVTLMVATTDSPAAQFTLNEAAVRNGVPAIYVGAYERAYGGEVLVVRPGAGPCLHCATGFRANLPSGIELKDRRQAYQAADANRLEAEPGLGADIAYLAAVAAAYALALLDPDGMRAGLLDGDRAFTLVHGGSRPRDAYADLFRRPFELLQARVTREEPCPVCGYLSAPGEVS